MIILMPDLGRNMCCCHVYCLRYHPIVNYNLLTFYKTITCQMTKEQCLSTITFISISSVNHLRFWKLVFDSSFISEVQQIVHMTQRKKSEELTKQITEKTKKLGERVFIHCDVNSVTTQEAIHKSLISHGRNAMLLYRVTQSR